MLKTLNFQVITKSELTDQEDKVRYAIFCSIIELNRIFFQPIFISLNLTQMCAI